MNKIKDLLRRLTILRALVLGGFLAALYYSLVYDNGDVLNRTIANAQKEIESQTKQLKDMNDKLDRAHEYQRSAAEMGEALNRLLSYIPEDFRGQDFMKLLSEEAKIAGLNIIRINEASTNNQKDKKAEFEELLVQVDFQGSFAQQMTFLANLTKRKQIFIVDDFQFTKERNGGPESEFPVVRFHAAIKAYRYIGAKPKS